MVLMFPMLFIFIFRLVQRAEGSGGLHTFCVVCDVIVLLTLRSIYIYILHIKTSNLFSGKLPCDLGGWPCLLEQYGRMEVLNRETGMTLNVTRHTHTRM